MQPIFAIKQEWACLGSGVVDRIIAGLKPHEKLLLVSEGSMTEALELLLGQRITIELKHKGLSVLGREDAGYLQTAENSPAFEREVWIKAGKKRLIYARSRIPSDCIEGWLSREFELNAGEPIGRVLTQWNVPFTKQGLQAAMVECRDVALDLALPEHTVFLARRYILSNRAESGRWVIKASVTEVFSPDVINIENQCTQLLQEN